MPASLSPHARRRSLQTDRRGASSLGGLALASYAAAMALLARSLAVGVARRPWLLSQARGIARLGTDDPRMSRAVVHNGLVYTSGQTAADAGDAEAQTIECLRKIDELLASAGTDKSRALMATIWLKDIGRDFKAMNKVWCDWVDPEQKPVRATTQAEMARESILVEIQITAATYDD